MPFDFPNSPSNGQQFTPAGGPTYVFTAGVWKLVGGIGAPGNLSISDTPPPSPQVGQMWWESDTGNLFAWWDDGNSAQWVQINVPNATNAVQKTGDTMSGALTVNALISAFGGAIVFPGTQISNAGVTALDDYQESNSWTPTIAFGGASVGITYGTRVATYTKIGRFMFLTFDVPLTSKGTSTGSAGLSGFPLANAQNWSIAFCPYWTSMAGITGNIGGYGGSGSTGITLTFSGTANIGTLNDTNFTNTSRIIGMAFCQTAT